MRVSVSTLDDRTADLHFTVLIRGRIFSVVSVGIFSFRRDGSRVPARERSSGGACSSAGVCARAQGNIPGRGGENVNRYSPQNATFLDVNWHW